MFSAVDDLSVPTLKVLECSEIAVEGFDVDGGDVIGEFRVVHEERVKDNGTFFVPDSYESERSRDFLHASRSMSWLNVFQR